MSQRDYRFDNLKLLLIFLVVFGHMLELMADKTFTFDLYMAIYAFHMPAFVFVSGYFACFSPKKIISRLVIPYVIFQVLYIMFSNLVFGMSDPIQLFTPYWLMWYMLAMVFCYCLIPFLDIASTPRSKLLVVSLTIAISLLVGFDNQVGRFLSLSRFFDFLPYFAAGYYIGTSGVPIGCFPRRLNVSKPFVVAVSLVLSVVGVSYVLANPAITPDVLYGASSYETAGYAPMQKATLYLIAASIIVFLLAIAPTRKIPFLSSLGTGTLSIYILHGFIIRGIAASPAPLFVFGEASNFLLALVLSAALVAVLGAKSISNAFSRYATGRWIEEMMDRKNIPQPVEKHPHPKIILFPRG